MGSLHKSGLFAGLSTLDLIYHVSAPPLPDSKNVALEQSVYAGGPAANAAITFVLLGGDATLLSPIGTHVLSEAIKQDITANRVRLLEMAPAFESPPPVASVLVTEDSGERIVISAASRVHSGAALTIPPLALQDYSFVLSDGHYLETLARLLYEARQAGLPLILDGGSWKPALAELLPLFEVVIASSGFRPPGCTDHKSVLHFLAGRGVRNAAITRGSLPILVLSGEMQVIELAVPRVQAVDTLGAGDVFHGAFCAAYPESDFRAALEYSAGIASLSTTVHGPRDWTRKLPLKGVAGSV